MADRPLHLSTCCNTSVRRASRRLGQLYDEVLAPSGLRATQATLMGFVADADNNIAMSELARLLIMNLSALGQTLKPLVRDHLVVLQPDAEDRRIKRVKLTPKGRARLKEADRLWHVAQHSFNDAFGLAEAEALRAAMARIHDGDFARRFGEARAHRAKSR
jgi:DNA-binding MarR family transcriptional regulator